ncbi:hypothetical protein ACJRO7_003934 [Eucalyptus globulus]|uniref:Cytochrome P450 n=1 Tax=Eucalyptus globulus TaxID=34317 RepID=A0ABD3IZE3_EUCGL
MELQVLKLVFTAFTVVFLGAMIRVLDIMIWRPQRLRSKLREQGVRGPPGSFLIGNLRDIKIKMLRSHSTTPSKPPSQEDEQALTHDCSSELFPSLDCWRQKYGSVFMFSVGNIQILYVYDVEAVKEMSTCTSLDFGKSSLQLKVTGPLIGQGISSSNGAHWAHQRKILAPELYVDKVKGMINLMVESSITLVNSWSEKIEKEGGVAEIEVDSHLRSFSGDVIAKACFGSNFAKGQEVFQKLRDLEEEISKTAFFFAIPGFRYLPTKSNREIWKLEREIRSIILKVAKERKETAPENDLLQMILEGAEKSGKLGRGDLMDRFIVDNCKIFYLAGYQTTAVAASWTLMLLASNPEWQAKVRDEVVQVLRGGQFPDADALRKMKTLTMVIYETLRLYPPVALFARETLEDMKFRNIQVPKGVNIWILTVTLHQDPEIWGPDAGRFNPERFANGVPKACKLPHTYLPFGAGPRSCLGQNFAMMQLKVLLALIISNFSLEISPKYRHSPALTLVIEPEFGVDLIVRRL